MNFIKDLIITKDARTHHQTQKIVNRIKKINNVNISYSNDERPAFPNNINTPAEKYHYMKSTLVLAYRKSAFIETFASPGDIIENMGTMIKSGLHCSYECQYCYLQTTALRQPWQKIFVNFDQIENEIRNEFFVDPLLRSILTIVNKLNGSPLNKIPKNFKQVADKIRNRLSGKGIKNLSEEDALKDLERYITFYLAELKMEYDMADLRKLIPKLEKIYAKNKKFKPEFNISEYTDILGINHISGQMDFFTRMVQKYPDFKMILFTKSSDVNSLLAHSGDKRVTVVMHMDPPAVIDKYQKRTSSLNDRIDAAIQIQNVGSYRLKLSFEPILMYKGYEDDLLQTVKKIAGKLKMKNLESINLGCVRFSGQLKNTILENYPTTDILNLEEQLEPPVGETKYRYPLISRVEIYKKMIEEIRKYTDCPITLGAEKSEAWIQSGLNSTNVKNFYSKLK